MFSSCFPPSSLVAGVKIGSGSRSASRNPASSGMPQTVRLALILLPPAPREVTARNALDRDDFSLAHVHGATDQLFALECQRKAAEIGAEQVMGNFEPVEPEDAHGGENAPLVRNAGGHHPIEGADAVGGDDDERFAEVVHIANLAAATGEAGHVASQEGFG